MFNTGRRSLLICALAFALSVISWGQGTQFTQAPPTSPNAATPAVPRWIKFSGTLLDSNGAPRTGTAGVTFAVYAQSTGGSSLWMETQNVTLDANGKYSVLLGAGTLDGLPVDLFNAGDARWLGVQAQFPAEGEQPRVILVSVPYALKAADAATLGGRPASDYALASSSNSNTSQTG